MINLVAVVSCHWHSDMINQVAVNNLEEYKQISLWLTTSWQEPSAQSLECSVKKVVNEALIFLVMLNILSMIITADSINWVLRKNSHKDYIEIMQ